MIARCAWIGLAVAAFLLGGCSLAGSLHFGDVNLGLNSGLAAFAACGKKGTLRLPEPGEMDEEDAG